MWSNKGGTAALKAARSYYGFYQSGEEEERYEESEENEARERLRWSNS